jgi:uncharacterized protein (TIGR02466 family)
MASLDILFPVPIYRTMVDEAIIDNSLRLVNQHVKETNMIIEPGLLSTTYYDDKKVNFLGQIENNQMLDIINIEARKFFKLLGYKSDGFIEISSWLQLNPPGSYFHRHDHYGALVSGVFYLQTPLNSGDLSFYNPIEVRRQNGVFFGPLKEEQNQYNFNTVSYPPVKCNLIMFESWLQHSVGLNESTENRISISFNIWGELDGKC